MSKRKVNRNFVKAGGDDKPSRADMVAAMRQSKKQKDYCREIEEYRNVVML